MLELKPCLKSHRSGDETRDKKKYGLEEQRSERMTKKRNDAEPEERRDRRGEEMGTDVCLIAS